MGLASHWCWFGLVYPTGGTPGKREYSMIYSKDAYSTDTFDPEYYSYCPDAEAFNKTLVRGKILICNFLQLFTGGAGIEIDDAIVTAKKLGAVGLIIVSPEIAESSQQPKSTILDPRPYSLPTTFITDTDASLVSTHVCVRVSACVYVFICICGYR